MFIREKHRKNKDGSVTTYLQLVQSQRLAGRSRQKVLSTLGRKDDPRLGKHLSGLVETAARYARLTTLLLEQGMTVNTQVWGPELVWRRVWRETVGPLVDEALGGGRLSQAAYLMILHRLVDPGSKCAAFRFACDVYGAGLEKVELHDLYHALDVLAAKKETIERAWFLHERDLFTGTDLVYFDTTSSYLEGSHPEGWAQFGYSRDHRGDRRQLAVGVVVTRAGLPIAHLVLPGATADRRAFEEAIRYLKETLGVEKVIVCADRGMVSAQTVTALREAQLEYILATRMRRDEASQEALSRAGRYHAIEETLLVKEVAVEEGEDRRIVCHNPQAAKEDAREREAIVKHLEEVVSSGTTRSLLRGAARRYVKTEGGTVALDREKIESDARYDGKWVLRTNTALSTADVAQAYKGLWRVEQAFRTLKTPLELRPIYHWTEKRIRGHLVVCFLAFLLRTVLKQRLDDAGWEGSFTAVLDDLSRLRAVTIASPNGERYRMRDEIPASLLPVFHALKIASPRRLEKLD